MIKTVKLRSTMLSRMLNVAYSVVGAYSAFRQRYRGGSWGLFLWEESAWHPSDQRVCTQGLLRELK